MEVLEDLTADHFKSFHSQDLRPEGSETCDKIHDEAERAQEGVMAGFVRHSLLCIAVER